MKRLVIIVLLVAGAAQAQPIAFRVSEPVFCGARADIETALNALLKGKEDELGNLTGSKRCLLASAHSVNDACQYLRKDGNFAQVRCLGNVVWTVLPTIQGWQSLQ
jgi:uncharacterized protein (UPF0333 family)